MYPTQVTSFLFITQLFHAYIKHNSPIFFSFLPLYTTTLIYHNTKHTLVQSTTSLLCKIDMFLCVVFYFAAVYDYLTRNTIQPPYSTICVGCHIGLPLSFMVAANYNSLMWNPDLRVSEVWHAVFHLLILFDTHLYLSNS